MVPGMMSSLTELVTYHEVASVGVANGSWDDVIGD